MNIQDNRRENLRRWIEKNGVPQKEKSYFSQLLGGASFGERAARRLEQDYQMGDGYLDRFAGVERPKLQAVSQQKAQNKDETTSMDEVIELLALFQQSTVRGRQNILDFARSAAKQGRIRWQRIADDEV